MAALAPSLWSGCPQPVSLAVWPLPSPDFETLAQCLTRSRPSTNETPGDSNSGNCPEPLVPCTEHLCARLPPSCSPDRADVPSGRSQPAVTEPLKDHGPQQEVTGRSPQGNQSGRKAPHSCGGGHSPSLTGI